MPEVCGRSRWSGSTIPAAGELAVGADGDVGVVGGGTGRQVRRHGGGDAQQGRRAAQRIVLIHHIKRGFANDVKKNVVADGAYFMRRQVIEERGTRVPFFPAALHRAVPLLFDILNADKPAIARDNSRGDLQLVALDRRHTLRQHLLLRRTGGEEEKREEVKDGFHGDSIELGMWMTRILRCGIIGLFWGYLIDSEHFEHFQRSIYRFRVGFVPAQLGFDAGDGIIG